jgi:hypothetical protein
VSTVADRGCYVVSVTNPYGVHTKHTTKNKTNPYGVHTKHTTKNNTNPYSVHTNHTTKNKQNKTKKEKESKRQSTILTFLPVPEFSLLRGSIHLFPIGEASYHHTVR